MKKDTIRAVIVAVVAFVLYNLIAFLIPFDQTETFWLSYVFTIIAFMVVGVSVYMAFLKNPDAKSRFYGFPIARIGVIYAIAQVVASLLFMTLASVIVWWVALLMYAIGLGAAVIGLVAADAVADAIQQQDVKLKKDTTAMRNLQARVSQLAARSGNADIAALAEEFRYSDPVSSEAISGAEANLIGSVYALETAFMNGNQQAVAELCRSTSLLLAERNRLCKMYKN